MSSSGVPSVASLIYFPFAHVQPVSAGWVDQEQPVGDVFRVMALHPAFGRGGQDDRVVKFVLRGASHHTSADLEDFLSRFPDFLAFFFTKP